jgi:hypothetical protein
MVLPIEGKIGVALRKPDLMFTDPTFPFEINAVSGNEMISTFNPPFENAEPTKPHILTVTSDMGCGISITPFQIKHYEPEIGTPQIIGGIVIGVGNAENLVLISTETCHRDGVMRIFDQETHLLKVDDDNIGILVKPRPWNDDQKPYVLDNNYYGDHQGLRILEDKLKISHTRANWRTLVERINSSRS